MPDSFIMVHLRGGLGRGKLGGRELREVQLADDFIPDRHVFCTNALCFPSGSISFGLHHLLHQIGKESTLRNLNRNDGVKGGVPCGENPWDVLVYDKAHDVHFEDGRADIGRKREI